MVRAWLAAAAIVLGLASAATADGRSGLRDRKVVHLGAGPPGLLRAGEGRGDALFVRLVSLRIGGNFDAAAAEEVVVTLSAGGRSATLHGLVQELGPTVTAIACRDSPWLELVDDRTDLTIVVEDDDATGDELITRTPEPVRPVGFGAEGAPAQQTVRLATITGWEAVGPLYLGKKEIKLEGASLALAFVRAPRREAADGASRAVVREHLDAATRLAAPADAATLAEAERVLERCATGAAKAARCSTHTHARRVLRALAVEAGRLAEQASLARAAEPAAVQAALRGLVDAARGLSPDERTLTGAGDVVRAAGGLASRPAVTKVDAALVEELRTKTNDLAKRLRDARRVRSTPALNGWRTRLSELVHAVQLAKEGLEAKAAVRDGVAQLAARIKAES